MYFDACFKMRRVELEVVTWKNCEDVDGEQRARPRPGAFVREFAM